MQDKPWHTPQPWRVDNKVHPHFPYWDFDVLMVLGGMSDEPLPVAAVLLGGNDYAGVGEMGNEAEFKANARLISSSPVMFDYIERKAQQGDEEAAKVVRAVRGECNSD